MANNCVHYGSPTDSLGKSRTKLGSPDFSTYPHPKSLVYAPDCITCVPTSSRFHTIPLQCQSCIRIREADMVMKKLTIKEMSLIERMNKIINET